MRPAAPTHQHIPDLAVRDVLEEALQRRQLLPDHRPEHQHGPRVAFDQRCRLGRGRRRELVARVAGAWRQKGREVSSLLRSEGADMPGVRRVALDHSDGLYGGGGEERHEQKGADGLARCERDEPGAERSCRGRREHVHVAHLEVRQERQHGDTRQEPRRDEQRAGARQSRRAPAEQDREAADDERGNELEAKELSEVGA
jgi:hypothetical protein